MSSDKGRKPGRLAASTGKAKGNRKGRSAPASLRARSLSPQMLFPKLAAAPKEGGQGAYLTFATREKNRLQLQYARFETINPPGKNKQTPTAREPAKLARLLHGLAHADRLRMMEALYQGARTHQDLKEIVGLQAGPLYHHMRELERAGLAESVNRNDYQITETGRIAMLLASGLEMLAADTGRKTPWQTKCLRMAIKPSSTTS